MLGPSTYLTIPGGGFVGLATNAETNYRTHSQYQPLQLELAIKFAPLVVREHCLQEAHGSLLVSRGKGTSAVRRPAPMAWRWPEIELRTPDSFPALILDVDKTPPDYLGVAVCSADARAPNWVVTNPATGHGHVVNTLTRSVLRGGSIRIAPVQKLARWLSITATHTALTGDT